ncbi:MAG TPA: translation initiation factor IF-3 [Candidatus Paceibacterota bacterium]
MYHKLNQQIRASEVRVIGPKGENFGVLPIADALSKAKELDFDLIEISPNATPPIAKIADYGKFLYEENKKQKAAKAKVQTVEIKTLQVKVGTGDHDLALKARKASEWITEGHRIRIDLFLPGRTKYMDEKFLKERMGRLLNLITVDFRIAEEPKKSPKGLSALIEKAK